MRKTDRAATLQVAADVLSSVALGKPVTALDQPIIFRAAQAAQRAAKRAELPVLELPVHATPKEINTARRSRAVKRGQDIYLPSWQNMSTAMPNLMLRSALWSVRTSGLDRESLRESAGVAASLSTTNNFLNYDQGSNPSTGTNIPALGDITLINRGPALGWYDRKVFATCLDHYREDRPLSPGGASSWVKVSFFHFLECMGVGYHIDSHHGLRASFERLSALSLHVRHAGLERHLPRILEVSFADGKARGEAVHSSDLICFRILEPFADLYGIAKWTAVPHAALNAGKGLRSWLTSFYSTHRRPHALKFSTLHQLTGSIASPKKFQGQLENALKELQSPEFPDAVRLKGCELTATHVKVYRAAWRKAASAIEPDVEA